MISNSLDTAQHDFLTLTYVGMDFLVNYDQISASLFLDDTAPLASHNRYFQEQMSYYEECVPVFDLDLVLQESFGCKLGSLVKFVLLIECAACSAAHQAMYQEQILRSHPELSTTYIAFKVSSHAQITTIALVELDLLPANLRQKQTANGILGLRFPPEGGIQYFLDLETLMFNRLRNE